MCLCDYIDSTSIILKTLKVLLSCYDKVAPASTAQCSKRAIGQGNLTPFFSYRQDRNVLWLNSRKLNCNLNVCLFATYEHIAFGSSQVSGFAFPNVAEIVLEVLVFCCDDLYVNHEM